MSFYGLQTKSVNLQTEFACCSYCLPLNVLLYLPHLFRYIVIMSNKKGNNSRFANQAKAGTGGTGMCRWLKSLVFLKEYYEIREGQKSRRNEWKTPGTLTC